MQAWIQQLVTPINTAMTNNMVGAARADLHEFPIKNLFPLMGQTVTTQEFLESVKD